jgi:hypothetical protein
MTLRSVVDLSTGVPWLLLPTRKVDHARSAQALSRADIRNSRCVRMFLAAKGLFLSLVSVDLVVGEQLARPVARSILAASFRLSCLKTSRRSTRSRPLALSRGGISSEAASGRDAQRNAAGDHVRAARRARRFRGRDGGRPQCRAGLKGRAIAGPRACNFMKCGNLCRLSPEPSCRSPPGQFRRSGIHNRRGSGSHCRYYESDRRAELAPT